MERYTLQQTVAPAGAVTLAEAKAACRVLHDDEDDYIALLVAAAVDLFDGPFGYLGQAIMTQTWRAGYPGADVRGGMTLDLPFGPVTAVTGLASWDGTSETALDTDDFIIGLERFTATIAPLTSWPVLDDRPDALRVTFVAGDDDARARTKMAILLTVAHWFNHREEPATATADFAALGIAGLLENDRRRW